jgi:membrane protein YqaA with SNARE-associated domain
MNDEKLPPTPSQRRLTTVRILTALAVVAALVAALVFRDRLQELDRYGYAAVFVVGLVSNATLILPVPGLAASSVLGSVFNPWIVGLAAGIGQALGELTGYMAGYSGQTWVNDHPRYDRLVGWMQHHGAWTIFVLALLPNPLFDVAGLIAGVLRLPIWKFMLSVAVGKVIKNIAFAVAGYYGIEALFSAPPAIDIPDFV